MIALLRRRMERAGAMTAIVAAVLLLLVDELSANGALTGRLIWTYQNNNSNSRKEELFVQHYEARLSDRVFESNNLRLSFYLDTSKNFTTDLTLLRYRGELNLIHKYYVFDARFSPRQEITPLQSPIDQERTEQQYSLTVHPPRAPQVRLFYATRAQYLQGMLSGRTRDMRGDLRYRWKALEFGVNRWDTRNINGAETGTAVTGGRLRYTQAFGPMLNVQTGYDYQNTQRTRSLSVVDNKTTTHTFNALLASYYRNIISSSLSFISRQLRTESVTETTNRNDNAVAQVRFLPTSPFRTDLTWSYLLSEQENQRTLANYATVQFVLTGPRRGRWHGLAQVARRFKIDVAGAGVIPSHLYFVSLRGDVYKGINARAELSVAEKYDETPGAARRYQSTSLLDLFLKPRPSWLVSANIRFIRDSNYVTFLRNDRINYGLTANYFARQYFNMSADLRRNEMTIGPRQQNTSLVLSTSLKMRARSSLNFSYGVNETRFLNELHADVFDPYTRANSLNLQLQVWITRRGAFSLNLSDVSRNTGVNTRYVAVNYRQDF